MLLLKAMYPSKTFFALSLKLSVFPVFIPKTAIIINRQNLLVCNSNKERGLLAKVNLTAVVINLFRKYRSIIFYSNEGSQDGVLLVLASAN